MLLAPLVQGPDRKTIERLMVRLETAGKAKRCIVSIPGSYQLGEARTVGVGAVWRLRGVHTCVREQCAFNTVWHRTCKAVGGQGLLRPRRHSCERVAVWAHVTAHVARACASADGGAGPAGAAGHGGAHA